LFRRSKSDSPASTVEVVPGDTATGKGRPTPTRREAEAAALRADRQAQRRYGRRMGKMAKEAMEAKGNRDR